ncbi:Uncharacterised protein [Vibrio cholerae]|nr:Uncharacterised protein [Vibrio cholerae]
MHQVVTRNDVLNITAFVLDNPRGRRVHFGDHLGGGGFA